MNFCQRYRKKTILTTCLMIEYQEENPMRISYNKLWKLLIDKGMNKRDLKAVSGVSSASIAKLGKCENITTDVLLKICESLNVHLDDFMETIDE
mgnify:CR=1 FL=1